jgi:hypothetical protein
MKSNPLLKFAPVLSGRGLFAQEMDSVVMQKVKERKQVTGEKNTAAIYQNVLKELWDNQSGSEQADWNSRAEVSATDITK